MFGYAYLKNGLTDLNAGFTFISNIAQIVVGSRNRLSRLYVFNNDPNLVQVVELSNKLILELPCTTINILDPDNFTSTCSKIIAELNACMYVFMYVYTCMYVCIL